MIIIFAKKYFDWQEIVLKCLLQVGFDKDTGNTLSDEWRNKLKDNFSGKKDIMTKAMQFGSFVINQYKLNGETALDLQMPFDEEKILK